MSGESALEAKSKDWHSSKDMRKRARHLLEHPDEEIPSDVTFLVGDGLNQPQKTFKCHKFLLAMVSSMFQAMFYGSLRETDDVIKIPDVTPVAFENMLRYAYGQDVVLMEHGLGDALDTLPAPKSTLSTNWHASVGIVYNLSWRAVNTILAWFSRGVYAPQAPQMDEEDLAGLALARIALSAPKIMDGDEFLRLSFDCLKRIVECPYLKAREITIYLGVRRWLRRNAEVVTALTGSALRDAFGTLFYSIRFPLCNAAELSNGPVKDGVLTGDELSSLFQFLFSEVKPTVPFLTMPRSPLVAPFRCLFQMLCTPSILTRKLTAHTLYLDTRPDLAPECCAFFRHLVDDECHIRIASFDNEHVGNKMPLPAAVREERNVLSHSIEGACWFEWDMDSSGTARNVRIGVGKKPDRFAVRSAVFGFVEGYGTILDEVPFSAWNGRHLQRVARFRIQPL